ncbi:hypothetical protein OQA88_1824 [Cercophora sp. LCS_1]
MEDKGFVLFIACFCWNHDRETVCLSNVFNNIDGPDLSLLRHNLNLLLRFEDAREAKDSICGTLGVDRIRKGPKYAVDVGWATVEVQVQRRQDVLRDICVRPMTLLDVSVGLRGLNEIVAAGSQGNMQGKT